MMNYTSGLSRLKSGRRASPADRTLVTAVAAVLMVAISKAGALGLRSVTLLECSPSAITKKISLITAEKENRLKQPTGVLNDIFQSRLLVP
jgi:hypothetical protein